MSLAQTIIFGQMRVTQVIRDVIERHEAMWAEEDAPPTKTPEGDGLTRQNPIGDLAVRDALGSCLALQQMRRAAAGDPAVSSRVYGGGGGGLSQFGAMLGPGGGAW